MNFYIIESNARKSGLGFDSVMVSPFPFKFELLRGLWVPRTATLLRVPLLQKISCLRGDVGLITVR